MMKRSKAGIGAMLILPLLLFFPLGQTEVSWKDHTIYIRDQSFSIQWVHSVEKEEWLEFYERNEKNLILTKTKFKTFGAGVPSSGKSTLTNEGFVEVEINRKMDTLHLVVSPRVKSTLRLTDCDILLYQMVEPYEEVLIKPTRIPVYQYVSYLVKKEGL